MANLLDTPKYNDLIYDIGMHKGEDSEFYLRKGFRVVAIEADPELVCFGKARLGKFIADGRLTIIEGAIIDPRQPTAGKPKVRFFRNEANTVWGTINAHWAERNALLGASSQMIEVDGLSLHDIIKKHGVPRYMKIDIEGADMFCVSALRDFANRPDYLSIESDKTSFAKIRQEIETLVDLGYDCFKAVEQSSIRQTQRPPFPAREGVYVAHQFEAGSSGLFGRELYGCWESKQDILRRYRVIRLGYFLVGDAGVLRLRRIWPLWVLLWPARVVTRNVLRLLTNAPVPGWYDTHARHCGAR